MKIAELFEDKTVLDVINKGGTLTKAQKAAIEQGFFYWARYEPIDAPERIDGYVDHGMDPDVVDPKFKELARKYLRSLT